MATQEQAAADQKGGGTSLLQKISGMVSVSKKTNADAQQHHTDAKKALEALQVCCKIQDHNA